MWLPWQYLYISIFLHPCRWENNFVVKKEFSILKNSQCFLKTVVTKAIPPHIHVELSLRTSTYIYLYLSSMQLKNKDLQIFFQCFYQNVVIMAMPHCTQVISPLCTSKHPHVSSTQVRDNFIEMEEISEDF